MDRECRLHHLRRNHGDETTLIIDTGANAAVAATIHEYASIARPANWLLALNTERHCARNRKCYHETRLANPNRPICEDSRMDLGWCEIEILVTPGHAPSNYFGVRSFR